MDRWRDRVALVTGATSGIGRATASALAGSGLRVAALGRRRERLERLSQDVERAGGHILPLACDLRDEGQIEQAFAELRARWGGTDVLVNNAGLGRHAPLVSGRTASWREMLEVNVLALCICTREAVRDMRARGSGGHVLHVSSMAAHRVPEESGLYAATKFAVRAITEGLRRELREEDPPIRVTAISPGFVETEFAAGYWGDADAARRTYERYKALEPEDVAALILHALSRPDHVQIHDVLVRPTRQPD